MRVAIAGAGAVGQSIAQALLVVGHQVLLIERERASFRPGLVPDADWLFADACELGALQAAGIETCDVVVAATGDDKVNLVFALLCKTELAVPRVAARVNHPRNQWLFTPAWGVDVAVSTPTHLVAAVDEVVSVGDLVRVMTLQQSHGAIVEIKLPTGAPAVGTRVRDLSLPDGAALVSVLRGPNVITPSADACLQPDDELLLVVATGREDAVRATFASADE
jgi:trk system potassium uptake protein TrkA